MKNKLIHADLWIAGTVMFLMVFVVVVQVVFRYSGYPLSWPEEVARWMMIWITFVGASYSFRNGGLISVDYFVKKLFRPRAQKYIYVCGMLCMTAFFLALSYSSFQYMLLTIKKTQVYPVTRVPYAVIILALVLGGVQITIFAVSQIIKTIEQKTGGENI